MSNELKPQISLKLLPVEILLQILRFLGSDDTLALLSTTKSMRIPHLLPKIRLSPDSSLQNDIISFNQTGNYNFLLCDEVEPASDYFPFGRRKGLYKQTDRTIISVLPIHFYATAEIFYFEIQVVDASDDAEMRIGLVESKWDLCRPPGSMVDSVGFICRDGHIAVGTGYDDK